MDLQEIQDWLTASAPPVAAVASVFAAVAGSIAYVVAAKSAKAATESAVAAKRSADAADALVGLTDQYVKETERLVLAQQEQLEILRGQHRREQLAKLDLLLAEVKANQEICKRVEGNANGRPAILLGAWEEARGILRVADQSTADKVDRVYARLAIAREHLILGGHGDDFDQARSTLYQGSSDEGRSIVEALEHLWYDLGNSINAIKRDAPGFPLP